jgi:hypothetical protein
VRHAPRAQELRVGGLHTCWLDAHGLVVPNGIVPHDAVAPPRIAPYAAIV